MGFSIAFYKGTHAGFPGLYNRLVRARGRGPYSHVELVFSDGSAGSSSFMDGGVRFKRVEFSDGNWDILPLPASWERYARIWFLTNQGKGYDLMGNIFLAFGFFRNSYDRFFCSEAVAAALKIDDAFRFEPNTLFVTVKRLTEAYNDRRIAA